MPPVKKARTTKPSTKAPARPKVKLHDLKWAAPEHAHWTWSLIDYLINHPDFRRGLFGDSTKEAREAGRRKVVAKDTKTQQHAKLAVYIFSNDGLEREGYVENPLRYRTSVETRLRR
jgi:hypothetical protein